MYICIMSDKKRIVVDVEPELSKKVKAKTASLGMSIKQLITNFLTDWVK